MGASPQGESRLTLTRLSFPFAYPTSQGCCLYRVLDIKIHLLIIKVLLILDTKQHHQLATTLLEGVNCFYSTHSVLAFVPYIEHKQRMQNYKNQKILTCTSPLSLHPYLCEHPHTLIWRKHLKITTNNIPEITMKEAQQNVARKTLFAQQKFNRKIQSSLCHSCTQRKKFKMLSLYQKSIRYMFFIFLKK